MCHYCKNTEKCVEAQTVNGQTFLKYSVDVRDHYQELQLYLLYIQSVLGRKVSFDIVVPCGKQPLFNLSVLFCDC